jgi:hypothetical protein
VCWSMSQCDVACDEGGAVIKYRGKPQKCGIGSAGALDEEGYGSLEIGGDHFKTT